MCRYTGSNCSKSRVRVSEDAQRAESRWHTATRRNDYIPSPTPSNVIPSVFVRWSMWIEKSVEKSPENGKVGLLLTATFSFFNILLRMSDNEALSSHISTYQIHVVCHCNPTFPLAAARAKATTGRVGLSTRRKLSSRGSIEKKKKSKRTHLTLEMGDSSKNSSVQAACIASSIACFDTCTSKLLGMMIQLLRTRT